MTSLSRQSYGRTRPLTTNQPIIRVGGYTLDQDFHNLPAGMVIPGGTLVVYNDITRVVKILKTATITKVEEDNQSIIIDGDLPCIFTAGDIVAPASVFTDTNYNEPPKLSADTKLPTIIKITPLSDSYRLSLSDKCTALKAQDTLVQMFETGEGYSLVGRVSAITLCNTEVKSGTTAIDISTDAGNGSWYSRRIPPVLPCMLRDNLLTYNPNIKFNNSY